MDNFAYHLDGDKSIIRREPDIEGDIEYFSISPPPSGSMNPHRRRAKETALT